GAVAVSPDGANVYVASSVFARDASTGLLTFLEDHPQGNFGVPAAAETVVVSPDGRHVYMQSELMDFSRDPVSGRLTYRQAQQSGQVPYDVGLPYPRG